MQETEYPADIVISAEVQGKLNVLPGESNVEINKLIPVSQIYFSLYFKEINLPGLKLSDGSIHQQGEV